MELLDELADAYLDNSFEHRYYLDLQIGRVVLDADVPKITFDEAYYVRVQFAKRTESDPELKLFTA